MQSTLQILWKHYSDHACSPYYSPRKIDTSNGLHAASVTSPMTVHMYFSFEDQIAQ